MFVEWLTWATFNLECRVRLTSGRLIFPFFLLQFDQVLLFVSFALLNVKSLLNLRASVCKYRKPGASCEIFNFFIFCLSKPFSELFSKIQLKVPKAL